MFRNYLKTTLRNLWKNKTYSFINLAGLAVGTLCCLYIVLYVQEEFSYDDHHRDHESIYRINTMLEMPGDKHQNATASPPIAPAMKTDFPEVKQFARVVQSINVPQHLLRVDGKSFYETNGVFVDSTFFDVFTYHFLSGNPATALKEPNSVVILAPTAIKLFGKTDVAGEQIEIDNSYGRKTFQVTGVIDETLGKSHIKANLFFTMNSGGIGDYVRTNNSWAGNNFVGSYVKLQSGADAMALQRKLPAFLLKYGAEQLKNLNMQKTLVLQPVASIHTSTDNEVEPEKTVSKSFLYLLLMIALLIQVIACINFMNLSTARASVRAREVGVRKVIGAERKHLVMQFLGESLLLTLISVAIAIPLLAVTIPYLNQVTGAEIQMSMLLNYQVFLVLAGIIIITGLVAGSYPAFYLSAFRSIKVLKGNFSSHISAVGIRKGLVVFQFVLSIVLIIGIVVIYSQLNYIKQKDLGFQRDQQLIFSFHTSEDKAKINSFAQDLRQLSGIRAVSRANNYLSHFVFNDMSFYPDGGNMSNAEVIQFMMVDKDFVQANGIRIIAGRDFRLHDSTRVLVNETVIRKMGLKPENAIGAKLYSQAGANDPLETVEIAGVMQDFNYNSLHSEVKPFMIVYATDEAMMSRLTVNAGSSDYRSLLGSIKEVWTRHLPNTPFEFAFMDEEVQKQYQAEFTVSRIINSFAMMAIAISCLGLFGLATFSAEQRKKEIGIRKVVGASVAGIVALLSRDFLKLVLIAFVISIPIAWWAMDKWLQAFAYRVPVSWWMFAGAGLLAIFIAFFTMSFQAIRAGRANPVKSLRSE